VKNFGRGTTNTFGAYFRKDFKELARIYSERLPKLEEMAEKLEALLVNELKLGGIEFIEVETRVKTLESFLEKCMRKNINNPFTDITDLVGVRVIFPFLDDLDIVEPVIKKNFEILKKVDKKQEQGYKVFAYEAIHYHLLYEGSVFELQLRTLIQHTWAVLDQKLFYKTRDKVPNQIRRRMNRLIALFELVDEEFQELKNDCREYIRAYSCAKIQTLAPLPLDIMSLEAYHRTSFSNLLFIKENVDLTIEILHNYSIRTIGDLINVMEESKELRKEKSLSMPEYANYFDFQLMVVISYLKRRENMKLYSIEGGD
jgi:ppGpp synthetase/RelA/SpoT-type nucleotidyltranferase